MTGDETYNPEYILYLHDVMQEGDISHLLINDAPPEEVTSAVKNELGELQAADTSVLDAINELVTTKTHHPAWDSPPVRFISQAAYVPSNQPAAYKKEVKEERETVALVCGRYEHDDQDRLFWVRLQ
jgi:hypothetical protein